MKKICVKCNNQKDITEFAFNGGYRRNECKECQRKVVRRHYKMHKGYYNERNKKRREEARQWMQDLKASLCCEVCGEKHPATLDFHHKDPNEKEFDISVSRASVSRKKIQAEIKKCKVLCANCHRILHYDLKYTGGSSNRSDNAL